MSSLQIQNITITDYSEKSFVVRGDSQPHKDALKNLGGKWNTRLRDEPGWIFPMTKKAEVQKWQQTGTISEIGSRVAFYENEAKTGSSSSDRIIFSELRKMRETIDRLEKLVITLTEKLLDEEKNEEREILVLADSEDDYEEEKVPSKRLLGGAWR